MDHCVRPADPRDLPQLQALEAAADATYEPLFGPLDWPAPSTGEWRARQPGFVLVAVPGEQRPVVGFAHVLWLEGTAHLEQLAVHPDHHRQGIGTALVRAARQRAGEAGHSTLTLSTYADVPWNAPFYRRLGFTEVRELSPLARRLVEQEETMGLLRHGRRVVMQVALRSQVTDE